MLFFRKSRLLFGPACVGCLLLICRVTSIAQREPVADNPKECKTAAPNLTRLYTNSLQALQQGDLTNAHDGFERLVKMNPRSPEYRDSLGYVLMLQGEPKQAL